MICNDTYKNLPFIYENGGRHEDDLRLLLVIELNHVTPVWSVWDAYLLSYNFGGRGGGKKPQLLS